MLATVDQRPVPLGTIGMDLDSTLADFEKTALAVMKSASLTPERCVLENWTDWDLPKCFGQEATDALVASMNTPHFWLSLEPITGVTKAMMQLMQHYRVHIVTTRPLEFTELTRYWLALYEIPFDDLTVVTDKSQKLEVARTASFCAFVDDNAETAAAMLSEGLVVGQLVQPWNHEHPNIVRGGTWAELSLALLKALSIKFLDGHRLF